MSAADAIVQRANYWLHAGILELQPNQGWENKNAMAANQAYTSAMKGIGWYVGAEWCAASAILDWKEGYMQAGNSALWVRAAKLVSLNSQQMARNFHIDPIWPTSTTVPKVGCIVVWQAGNSLTQGHTGLCISVTGNTFVTVEGNTIPAGNPGNEREGYTIAVHVHTVGLPHSANGLNLDRFIYAIDEYKAAA